MGHPGYFLSFLCTKLRRIVLRMEKCGCAPDVLEWNIIFSDGGQELLLINVTDSVFDQNLKRKILKMLNIIHFVKDNLPYSSYC